MQTLDPDIGIDYTRSFVWRRLLSSTGGTPTLPRSLPLDGAAGAKVYNLSTTVAYTFTASGAGLITQVFNLPAGTADVTQVFQWLSVAVTLAGAGSATNHGVTVNAPAAGVSGSGTSFTISGLLPNTTYVFTATGTGLVTQTQSKALTTTNTTVAFTWNSIAVTLTGAGATTTLTATVPNTESGVPGVTGSGAGVHGHRAEARRHVHADRRRHGGRHAEPNGPRQR